MNENDADPMNIMPISGSSTGMGFAAPEVSEAPAYSEQPASSAQPQPELEMPEAIRSIAETSLSQMRETYDRAKAMLEEATSAFEVSLDKAGKGAAQVNVKLIDIAQQNLNAGFDFAKQLAIAPNPSQAMELHMAFVRGQMETANTQLAEIRELMGQLAAETSAPFQEQMSRSMQQFATSA